MPRAGPPISRDQDSLGILVGDRLEQCQDGSTAQPKCQEQLPHRPTDSTERKKGLHTTPFVQSRTFIDWKRKLQSLELGRLNFCCWQLFTAHVLRLIP